MPKFPQIKPIQIEKILLKNGFIARYGKGSHKVFTHKDGRRTVIPVHSRPIRIGTLKAILKQIKLNSDEFIKLLQG